MTDATASLVRGKILSSVLCTVVSVSCFRRKLCGSQSFRGSDRQTFLFIGVKF